MDRGLAMKGETLSDDLRRFIATVPTIPYLEAMVLMREGAAREWNANTLARQLYIPERDAAALLAELAGNGICLATPDKPYHFAYRPASPEIDTLVGRLAAFYACNIIEVTHLIHSRSAPNRRIQQFADAFKWRKDK